MHFTILTLFPEMFQGPLNTSIIKRAREKNLITIKLINIREFATDRYRTVDDHPYGGGAGMILRVDVVDKALQNVKSQPRSGLSAFAENLGRQPKDEGEAFSASADFAPPKHAEKIPLALASGASFISNAKSKTILLDPQGIPYTEKKAQELSKLEHLILVCGHYEGVDERIRSLVDSEISIGDYVLTGGEVPAMVIVDSVVRVLPGVLKKPEATRVESFSQELLEYPQYTRPPTYQGLRVPEVLLSGDHAKIAAWRKAQARRRTQKRRPDLVITKGQKDQV